MKIKFTICLIIAALFFTQSEAQYLSSVWISDQGNGRYKNPVLHADYSDPDAIRVGEDYYLVASSFNAMPGLPILHSKDLVNWKLINYALKKQEPEDIFNSPQHGKGVWAPSIIFHAGEYRIYYPDPDRGIFMVKTKNPAADWERPVLVMAGKGMIDPCAFWDDDGKAYLAIAWAGSRAGINSLLTLYPMNTQGTVITGEGRHIFDGHGENHTVEGPKLYKREGFYYLFAPAGGVATGWQLVMRSKHIYGPYMPRRVMDQGRTAVNGPHQGALVRTPEGKEWFLHFQDKGAYGRVLHLQPVSWKDGWPVIGEDADGDGTGEPVVMHTKPDIGKIYVRETPQESDEFNTDRPGLQWQWQANPMIQWSAQFNHTGYLRLFAYPVPKESVNLWPVPNLLLQKFPAPEFTATTKVTFTTEWGVTAGKKTGLLIMGNDYAYLSLSKDDRGYKVTQVICKDAVSRSKEQILAEMAVQSSTVYLRVQVSAPDASCTFSFSEDGRVYRTIGSNFTAVPDKWTGAKVGIFCISRPEERIGGYADYDWFRVTR